MKYWSRTNKMNAHVTVQASIKFKHVEKFIYLLLYPLLVKLEKASQTELSYTKFPTPWLVLNPCHAHLKCFYKLKYNMGNYTQRRKNEDYTNTIVPNYFYPTRTWKWGYVLYLCLQTNARIQYVFDRGGCTWLIYSFLLHFIQ